jgi:signal transduction histidine kinase
MLQRHPPSPSDEYGAMRVLRTGESVWNPNVTDDFLQRVAQDAEHLTWLRHLEPRSYICVPVRSLRSAAGALTFVTTGPGPEYDLHDLRMAEDLAHRAAIAIENAGLVAALRESDQRKDEFIAMLAHELRNPLAPIRNAAHIIQARGPQTPELAWAAQMIERQVHQMTRLVDDLLDVSRINSGKIALHRERIALADVVKAVVEATEQQITARNHRLEVSLPGAPVHVDADAIRLGQVLFNLLDNAAKYTDRGGQIRVSVTTAEGIAEIRVADTGVGIAREMQARIFEMFTQVDGSVGRSQGGLGIGLMLVRRLVEMHGGTVHAVSDGIGRGSEFVVRLPVAG